MIFFFKRTPAYSLSRSIFRFATLIDLTELSSLGFGGLGGDNYSLMESQVGL